MIRSMSRWLWNIKWSDVFDVIIIILLAMELFPWPSWLVFCVICGTISSLLAGIDATKGKAT